MTAVGLRIACEKEIARRTIQALLGAGYEVSVFDSEETVVKSSRDADKLLDAMMTTDEDHLLVNKPGGKTEGWVKFIYGNDGPDVINDYTTNLEEVLRPVNDYSDTLY